MSNLRCINCELSLSRMRRHALENESEDVVNTIRLWTYPRDITPTDHICHACWQLATYRDVPESMPSKPIGHRHVCVVCGRSIARINRRRVLIEGANEQEQRLAHIVSDWIQPRALTFHDEACVPCWLKARRRVGTIRPQPNVRLPDIPPHGVLYQDVMCAVCGQNLTSVLPSVKQLRPEDIARLSELRQISAIHEVCAVCWEQAQDVVPQTPRSQEPETESPQQTGTGLRDTEIPQVTERRQGVERPQYITLPNIRRAANTPRHCIFQECRSDERYLIPEEVRYRVLQQFQYYIPKGARICTEHLQEADFQNLYSAEYSLNTFTATHVEEIIFMLMERLNNINYENIQDYPDNQVKYFIGITKDQHQQILDATPRLRNMHRGSFALTVLLCKLRTGDSGERLSCLFQVPRRTLEILMSTARYILNSDYVVQFLGLNHLTREQMITKSLYIADHIFGVPEAPLDQKPMITIADGTYIYLQKSSNYLFQKNTYSLHKYRNLLKPFILCTSNGYIIDVRGPYSATTNDAAIMLELLNDASFNNFYKENDIFVLDRGFRDSMDSVHQKGYIGHMPETLEEGHSQLTTLQANRSRCVTINRWVVEAVNGRFKRDFKIFRHEYFNRACRHLMSDFKIAAALLNAFSTPFTDNNNAEQFVSIIFERLFMTNSIAEIVAQQNLNRRGSFFLSIDGTTTPFPRLSMEELTLFACGIYQIRQARSYVGEHFRFHGIYTLEVSRERVNGLAGVNPILLRGKIKSRHSSSKTYFVYIVVENNMNGREAIISYCCNCIIGLRTVGCCSHVMSIIWYLSYARHEGMTPPAPFLDEVVQEVQ